MLLRLRLPGRPQPTACDCDSADDEGDEGGEGGEGGDRALWLVFQCRVRPGAIRRPARAPYVSTDNDEEARGVDGVFEWVVEDEADVIPTALLVRARASATAHQPKTLLKVSFAPRGAPPLGPFDDVPGRIDAAAQAEAEARQVAARVAARPATAPPPGPACCGVQ